MSKPTDSVGHVKCKVSASLLPNNLTSNAAHIAYVHRSEVHLLDNKPSVLAADKTDTVKVQYTEKDSITQTQFAKLAIGDVLILITTSGLVHVYDEKGQKALHVHKLQKSQVALSARESLLRGIAHDGKQTLFIGTGSGDILVFSLISSKFTLVKKLEGGHSDAISALGYIGNSLISADEAGLVLAWSGEGDALTKSHELYRGQGLPATGIDAGHGIIAVAFSSGHLRLFSATTKTIQVEIAAHARTINALHVHPEKPLVVTASEDTYVSVWSLPSDKSPTVKNVLCQSPAPALLTGVRFVGPLIAVTAYDSRFVFSLPSP